jgi:hypothetical protein
MADQIVLVQPLHDDDDGASLLVVLSAVESVIVPFVGGSSLRFGERLFGLERVIDNDGVGAAPGQRATVRAGDPEPLAVGDELLYGLAVRRQAGWKVGIRLSGATGRAIGGGVRACPIDDLVPFGGRLPSTSRMPIILGIGQLRSLIAARKTRFASDSPVEETRFELPVPLLRTVCRILSNEGRSVPPSSAKNG